MKSAIFFPIIVFLVLVVENSDGKGIAQLDNLTFDKLVSKFKVSVVKFNEPDPYGQKQEVYTQFAEATYTVNDLLVGEVAVGDDDGKENEELIKRFNIKTEDFPVVKLFVDGTPEPYTFDAKEDDMFTYHALNDFIKSKKTGLYLGCAGCLEKFDKLVEEFMLSSDIKERKKILHLAEGLRKSVTISTEVKSADIYVKLMHKVIEKSADFVWEELKRVEKLLKAKVTKDKHDELQKRINILHSFKVVHDEL